MGKDQPKAETRSVVLGLLGLMGVHMSEPANAEMSVETLEKKLSTALTLCQALSDSDLDWFDSGMLRAWKSKASLSGAFKSRSLMAKGNVKRGSRGKASSQHPSPVDEDTFNSLNQIIMHVVRIYDEGHRRCVMQDIDQKKTICLRILDVHKYKEVPVVSLIYTTDEDHTTSQTANSTIALCNTGADDLAQIENTVEERMLFFRLLELNSTRLPGELKAKLKYHEEGCNASFLVPATLLKLEQIAKLASTPRCDLCGRLCSVCQTASYCGQETQRLHWEEHSTSCKGIQGSTWIETTFTKNPIIDGEEKTGRVYDGSSKREANPDRSSAPPENIHDDKTFMVKILRPFALIGGEEGDEDEISLLVYDRGRTFKAYVSENRNPEFCTEALRYMPMDSDILKIYRYAKRSGDWSLSVCMDREPDVIPQW
ncbi:hypothetical protein PENSPDRAFT_687545 [Peniophora sp. CONT]|nr:hypothetical protein PENSPDRAFT_687545 [Peniophora sp. CONT]